MTQALEPMMNKIVVAVDDSATATRVAAHAAKLAATTPMELHLVTVQPMVDANVSDYVGSDNVQDWHREQGLKALRPARELLDAAGVSYQPHVLVGHAAEQIAALAEQLGASQIVMGSHGRSGLGAALIGSVSAQVVQRSPLPVTLIK